MNSNHYHRPHAEAPSGDPESLKLLAYSLRAQVKALGGVGPENDASFIEAHPQMAANFYREVLRAEREINGDRNFRRN